MPTTYAIIQGNKYMDATLYTGTGATANITNTAGFLPDLTWVKSRSAATDHKLTDSVRGATKAIISDTTAAETTDSTGLTVFNTNGFTLGTSTVYNNSGATYVGWQWQAGQGTTSNNTTGTITSTVSANTTSGFSIVTYTGTGTTGTVGHGLGAIPQFIIVKARNQTDSWIVYHSGCPNPATNTLILNSTGAVQTSSLNWNSTAPTSSVFSVYNPGSGGYTNGNGYTYVVYCWAAISGFSSFGSYSGNGSSDGPFVYLGFRPKFIMFKRTDGLADWVIIDTSRNTYNIMNSTLYPSASAAEETPASGVTGVLGLSNGFKILDNKSFWNSSGTNNYIYMAFASTPFKYSTAF